MNKLTSIFISVIFMLSIAPKTSLGAVLGDCNGDSIVDVLDFQLLSNTFGKSQGQSGYNPSCDFDSSNSVDILDFQFLSNNFGRPATNPTLPPTSGVRAFPGAEGFGAATRGGRGGKVMEVTNLNDSGTGSFRECALASGPRTCVFRVAGTISLNSDIIISNPNLTIAGQTAPGGGITFKAASASSTTGIYIKTSEIIFRYVRSRPGTMSMDSRALSINNGSASMATAVRNVIIDHNSFSWAGDELTITWLATNNLSYQWNIAGQTLSPWKGPSFGEDGGGFFSVHHNLIAHNTQRNPQVSASVGTVDIVNNVIYNPGGLGSSAKNGTHVNYVKNYIKKGPGGNPSNYVDDGGNDVKGPAAAIYLEGNFLDGIPNIIDNTSHVVSTRLQHSPVTESTPHVAYDQVLADAGASKGIDCNGGWFSRRDTIDNLIVQTTRDRTCPSGGCYITNPSQVGGWPQLAAGTACADSDHDGMSDTWETNQFGNILRGSSNNSSSDFDADGYTDLEEYINGTNPKVRDATL
jgi:pectate lyase